MKTMIALNVFSCFFLLGKRGGVFVLFSFLCCGKFLASGISVKENLNYLDSCRFLSVEEGKNVIIKESGVGVICVMEGTHVSGLDDKKDVDFVRLDTKVRVKRNFYSSSLQKQIKFSKAVSDEKRYIDTKSAQNIYPIRSNRKFGLLFHCSDVGCCLFQYISNSFFCASFFSIKILQKITSRNIFTTCDPIFYLKLLYSFYFSRPPPDATNITDVWGFSKRLILNLNKIIIININKLY
ncbi:hypothetical protein [Chryseobacterium cucumeris]|uniref:hypothetical protein n=1 Tax=Chryseobacterium cucumeris TaxID=1813611 RepID=UPI0023F0D7EF|nr:hypothetical protein [Chryseobacterium cucumeris]